MTVSDDTLAERNARVHDLVSYWQTLRPAQDLLPSKRRFDPIGIPLLLPNIIMWEVVGGGADFVVRLAGLAVETLYGQRMKGFRVSSTDPAHQEFLGVERFRAVVQERRIDYRRIKPPHLVFAAAKNAIIDRVILPLANDGKTVDFIVGGYWKGF